MGTSASKPNYNDALNMCKERMKYIKQAIDCRNELSAAHLSYIQSLGSLGTALRRFAEAELLVESSLSHSDVDKSPSHSSYASPSPSRFPEQVGSPSLSGSPLSPRLSNMSYMMTTETKVMTLIMDSSPSHFVEDDSLTFPLPPPPPPLPEVGSSWDFFDPSNAVNNPRSKSDENGHRMNFSSISDFKKLKEAEVVAVNEEDMGKSMAVKRDKVTLVDEDSVKAVQNKNEAERRLKHGFPRANNPVEPIAGTISMDKCGSKRESSKLQRDVGAETEDASDFITHRAKDFLSSMRDIAHRFVRAQESGNEVSRMLETNKIRLGVSSETTGSPPPSLIMSTLNQLCCNTETSVLHADSAQNVKKVITWKRSVSSLSSLSRNQFALATKDDFGESASDFIEEYAMISGSHSSTLDRLFAWERKLYDEIKASEHIRKAYDQKCCQLRRQFARDVGPKLIDKTRAVVKDLHSRVMVAILSVDSISKRIERMRDEELQPQLLELIQGLIRMWKAMLECHHSQFITISLAYLAKSSTSVNPGEANKQALVQLRTEMEYFDQCFLSWVNAHLSYIEALNTWLRKCILQPPEPKRGKKAIFPPPRALSPPVFDLCSDWLAGLKSLPCKELCVSIKSIVSILDNSLEPVEDKQIIKNPDEPLNKEGNENKEDNNGGKRYSNLKSLQASLTKVFDCMTKFSEASLKVHEEVKQKNEIACIDYTSAKFR